jgi:hypothetical protein
MMLKTSNKQKKTIEEKERKKEKKTKQINECL